MITFTTVEDYLEAIAGYRDLATNKVLTHYVFLEFEPIVNLARYDVKILESMARAVASGQALTERQADLAVKIVLKYQRQLAQKGIDVTPAESPTWRLPLRKMDYSRRLYIDDDQLIVKFPYNNELIDGIREFTKDSQGNTKWDKNDRVWHVALTEYNLSWLYTWAQANQFEIDTLVVVLMNKIRAVESAEYKIELTVHNEVLTITNAESSLLEYINTHLGGLNIDNLIRLVDMSSVLGYTVDPDIQQAIAAEHNNSFCNFLFAKDAKLDPVILETPDFSSVLDYADRVERWPVVLYEPDASNRLLQQLKSSRPSDAYVHLPAKSNDVIPEGVKYIHTLKPISNLEHIPLLVSSAGMMFGGDKSLMLQRAEKVVYCVTDVYNKKK
jgi:hypothetical protein